MVEQNPQKISEALVRLGIKKTKLSEVLAISRPTLDKYIDVYDSGDRSTLPKRIHQSFLHISGYLEPENVDGYLSRLRNQYVIHDRRHCRPVCPVVVVDGLISPTDVLPPSFNEEEFLELSSRLSYKDTVSLIKALMASQCGDLTARYFGTDLPRPGSSYFEEKKWPIDDSYTFFFLNMLSEIVDDPLIRNSRFRDINCLRGYTDFALDCSMFPIESTCDSDPHIKINDLMQEIGYSKRDSESSWYFAAYFYPCWKYLPSPVEMVTDHFQAVDLEDAYAQALAIDSRDNPSYRAMSI